MKHCDVAPTRAAEQRQAASRGSQRAMKCRLWGGTAAVHMLPARQRLLPLYRLQQSTWTEEARSRAPCQRRCTVTSEDACDFCDSGCTSYEMVCESRQAVSIAPGPAYSRSVVPDPLLVSTASRRIASQATPTTSCRASTALTRVATARQRQKVRIAAASCPASEPAVCYWEAFSKGRA